MGLSLHLALRNIRSKKKAFVSIGTLFATLGVLLGVAALTTVVSVTGGFFHEFQDKVLGVNAHVLVLKYSSDFREYRDVIKTAEQVPGVTGVAPFVINPMMITHGKDTATGILLKGVDPEKMGGVLDLPKQIIQGSLAELRAPGALPPKRKSDPFGDNFLPSPGKSNRLIVPGALPSPSPSASSAPVLRPTDLLDMPEPSRTAQKGQKLSVPRVASAEPPPVELELTPEGGYGSTLPDEDILPDDIVSDPCSNPETSRVLPGIVIGKTLRENLKVELGGCLQVTSPTVGFSYSGGVIRAPVAKQFRVIAVFDAGFDQYDTKLVYTDLYQAQSFYDGGDTVTGVEMRLADVDRASAVSREIERRLENGIYHTMDWEQLNHGLFTALRIQQILISLVLALIIVVAAFTVIATLIMVVLEKKREIAVLKSMGATDGALLRVFMYQGSFIGLLGTFLGIALGYLVCRGLMRYEFPLDPGVYFISRLPVRMVPGEFLAVGVFSLVVCLVATIWPALYAARLRPAEAFRSRDT